MNDNDNKEQKEYFWIKLKLNFFGSNEIDYLLSQQNGCEYVVLYQMLCLMSANTKGNLSYSIGERIVPYDIEKIARDTKHFSTDTIMVALKLFNDLGLIYVEKGSELIRIANIEKMIGNETRWAIIKRKQREKDKEPKPKMKALEVVEEGRELTDEELTELFA